MPDSLDTLTKQIMILTRHFWHARDMINVLTHTKQDSEEVKYLQIAYDDISHLIELVESFRDTINSTRDLYMANASLKINDNEDSYNFHSYIIAINSYCRGIWYEWS